MQRTEHSDDALSSEMTANINMPAMSVSHLGSESFNLTWSIAADATSSRKAIPWSPAKTIDLFTKLRVPSF